MSRPDTSALEKWADPDAIQSLADDLRADGAKYGSIAEDVEVYWADLNEYFRVYNAQDWMIMMAGGKVSDYARAVASGADNMAKCLEECVSFLKIYDNRRQDIFRRAAAARIQLSEHPEPELEDGNIPESYATDQMLHEAALNTVRDLEYEIGTLAADYRSLMSSIASQIEGIEDDGSSWNPYLGLVFDAALIAAGAFIPPAGGAVMVISAGKTFYDEYKSRSQELKNEHPELSDGDVRRNAGLRTGVVAPGLILFSHGAGKVGGKLLGDGAEGPVGWGAGLLGSGVAGGSDVVEPPTRWAPGDRDFHQPTATRQHSTPPPKMTGPWSPEELTKQVALQTALNDPERIRQTKDYDRDGYTDTAFRPGPRIVTAPNGTWQYEDSAGMPELLLMPPSNNPFTAITDE